MVRTNQFYWRICADQLLVCQSVRWLGKNLATLGEIDSNLERCKGELDENEKNVAILKEKAENHHHQIIISDLDAITRYIDPSGNLAGYCANLLELETRLQKSPSDSDIISKQIQTRYEIRKLLDGKIK